MGQAIFRLRSDSSFGTIASPRSLGEIWRRAMGTWAEKRRPATSRDRKKDCSCPISAEGSLSVEGLITNRSTRTAAWDDAKLVADNWVMWGQTTEPPQKALSQQLPSVEYAVESFLTSQGPTGRPI